MPFNPGHGLRGRFIQHEVQVAGEGINLNLDVQPKQANHDFSKAFLGGFGLASDDDRAAPRRFAGVAPLLQAVLHSPDEIMIGIARLVEHRNPCDFGNLLALVGANL